MARDLKAKIKISADTKAAEKSIGRLGKTSKSSFSDVEKGAASANTGIGRLSGGFASLAVKVTSIGLVFSAFLGGLKAAINASAEQEAAIVKLDAALASLGDQSKSISASLQLQASELQKITRFGDEQIIAAQSLIAAFVKEEEQLKSLTRVTTDFAEAKGISLASAADLITKTFASSTNALTRYGIEVEGAAGSTARLESLTAGLDKAFKGAAAAGARTFTGRVQQLSNAFGDLLEVVGDVITTNKSVLSSFSFLTRGLERATNLFKSITGSVGFATDAEKDLEDQTIQTTAALEAQFTELEKQRRAADESADSLARVAESELKLRQSIEPLIVVQGEFGAEVISGTLNLQAETIATIEQANAARLLRIATDDLTAADRRRTTEAIEGAERRRVASQAETESAENLLGGRSRFLQTSGGTFSIAERSIIVANGRVIAGSPSLRGITLTG